VIRTGGDGGSVVAEFAIALPAVVIVFLLGMGALGASARQLRLQDAVADAARLAARGEAADRVREVVGAAVPGAELDLEDRGDLVCVSATAPAVGLPILVSASSCALAGGL
jgi:hypothetical protein